MNPIEGEVFIVDGMQGPSNHSGFHLFILIDIYYHLRQILKEPPCAVFPGEAEASHKGRCKQ